MSVYLVKGPLAYREHKPGETFEAELAADVEERALRRGTIVLVERRRTSLQPGSWRLPHGWPSDNAGRSKRCPSASR